MSGQPTWAVNTQHMMQNNIPAHIAIIMDGNRRWAKARKLSPIIGHRYASQKIIEPLIKKAAELNVKHLTLWVWSTENWQRQPRQVKAIMNLFRRQLKQTTKRLREKGVKINVIGDISKLPQDIQKSIKKGIEETKNCKKITVTFALNYGGRDEIIRAVKKIIKAKKSVSSLNQKTFSSYLDTSNLPDPDLIIRTGGEKRLSGFMLWQTQYAELYFTNTLFPDFTPQKLEKAVKEFKTRQRRFGK